MRKTSEQEEFWRGDFGNEYASRNQGDEMVASSVAFFAQALRTAAPIASCVEFGANIGLNLRALRQLFPRLEQFAVEINPKAAEQLREFLGSENVFEGAISESSIPKSYDLALIKGVLIHINPDQLPEVYDRLAAASKRYVLIGEYYNPTPVMVTYRGNQNKLFKRDFCGEFLDRHSDFRLVDYGFVYHRDPKFPQDDTTWFLTERR
jgi:pseudaminic acid biosynthesis-associated methylase